MRASGEFVQNVASRPAVIDATTGRVTTTSSTASRAVRQVVDGFVSSDTPPSSTAHLEQPVPGISCPEGRGEGSCIVVVETDAPMLPHQSLRLVVRALEGTFSAS